MKCRLDQPFFTMNSSKLIQIFSLLFILVIQTRIIAGQEKCEITINGGTGSTIKFNIKERTPKGTLVGRLIVKHELTVPENVKLTFLVVNPFFTIENRTTLNETHTVFDFNVGREYDLFEQDYVLEIRQKLICEPNRGDVDVIVAFEDVNDKPVFNVTSMSYKIPVLPIDLPFSKMYAPIIVSDKDENIFGKLEFIVWDDTTFTTKNDEISAVGENLGSANEYLVNLHFKKVLNPKIENEYNVILMARDLSKDYPLHATIPIKITLEENSGSNLQPKFQEKTYSTDIRIKDKFLFGKNTLTISPQPIRATISDGSTIRYEIDKSFTKFASSFSMNANSGQIYVINVTKFVENGITNTFLFTRVFANNDQTLTDFCVIYVKINFLPQFPKSQYSIRTPRKVPRGSVLWTGNAGPFVTYSTKDPLVYYELNRETGSLSVQEGVVDEKITVIGNGNEGTTQTEVSIYVTDDDITENECFIGENEESGVCKGLSLSLNGYFRIISGNEDQIFEIFNGQLRCKSPLDYEKRSVYVLILHNKNSGKKFYVTVKVKNVKEEPYFEIRNKTFAIAPWIQQDHVIASFKAHFPDSKNPNITYSLVENEKISKMFRLNSLNGELRWVHEPSEPVYDVGIRAVDKEESVQMKIEVFALKISDIFSLKLVIENDIELDTKLRSIETDLSNIIDCDVGFLYWKPIISTERKSECFLFAVNETGALSYEEIERLITTSETEIKEKLGEYSMHPHTDLLAAQQKEREQEKKLTIIILSIIVGAMCVAAVGIILFKKCSSPPLQNTTSTKDLLQNEENSISDTKLDMENGHFVKNIKKVNETADLRVAKEQNVSDSLKANSLQRLVNQSEIVVQELTDEHADDLHEIHELDYELPEPEIDYKPGRKKSVSFFDESTDVSISQNDTENSSRNEITDDVPSTHI